jgi:hypothetical protein
MRHEITIATNIGSPKAKAVKLVIESCPELAAGDSVDPIFVDDLANPVLELIKKTIRKPPGLGTIVSWAARKGMDQLRNLPVSKISYYDNEGREQFKIITKFE